MVIVMIENKSQMLMKLRLCILKKDFKSVGFYLNPLNPWPSFLRSIPSFVFLLLIKLIDSCGLPQVFWLNALLYLCNSTAVI